MRCENEGCTKKLSLVASTIKCKCGKTFCEAHRADVDHKCAFDYRTTHLTALSSSLVKVVSKKIEAC